MYTHSVKDLQGGAKFPTGGKAREPSGMIRCDSEADSTVWMKEDIGLFFMRPDHSGCFFCLNFEGSSDIYDR